jgi:hypothetical protein
VIDVREATLIDFANFELHQNNIEELKASIGMDVDMCLAALWDISSDRNIVFVDDEPTCLLGVINGNEIWLFFSKNVNKLPLSFFKLSKTFIAKYDQLQGMVYSENTFALQWAKWMGFFIEKPEPYGIEGKLFHRFYKGKEG